MASSVRTFEVSVIDSSELGTRAYAQFAVSECRPEGWQAASLDVYKAVPDNVSAHLPYSNLSKMNFKLHQNEAKILGP